MFGFASPGIPSFGDLSYKAPVRVATVAALPANTRTGNVLTASANGALTVDSLAMVAADRVLVQNEATGANNGIYTVTNAGSAGSKWVLTRATDSDTSVEVQAGSTCWVTSGTWGKSLLAQTATGSATRIPVLNTDNLVYASIATNVTGVSVVVNEYRANATWTRPVHCKGVWVEVWGGGGSGGGAAVTVAGQVAAGGGGGGGGYARKWFPRSALGQATYSVAVPAAAAAAGAGASGNAGGTCQFLGADITTVQATGGAAGQAGAAVATTVAGVSGSGGGGGTGSGGDQNLAGSAGEHGRIALTEFRLGSRGGAAPTMSGSPTVSTTGTGAAGTAGLDYGGGSTGATNGASQAARGGAAGAVGAVVVTEIY